MFIIIFFITIIVISFYILKKYPNFIKTIQSTFLVVLISLMVFNIILFPKEIIGATQKGIMIWFNSVLPALLPFFIGAELLIGLGVVKFIGVLIEPIVRPIFKVPGEASFVFAMSITSGYPMGIKLTSNLRKKGVITKIEAHRMLAFCSTSGPLFMIGAVAIGMFNSPEVGPYIATSHYLAALSVGILFRFYGSNSNTNHFLKSNIDANEKKNLFLTAYSEMLSARNRDGRNFGQLLGDSVRESINTIVLVGGFIVLFSVVIEEISLLGILDRFYFILTKSGISSFIPKELSNTIITGFIEITMGCNIASKIIGLSPIFQIVLATMIISWSGLSIHAQAASLISNTDIDMGIYIISKIFHSIISGIYVYLIIKCTNFKSLVNTKEVFSNISTKSVSFNFMTVFIFSIKIFTIIVVTLILLGIVQSTLNRLHNHH